MFGQMQKSGTSSQNNPGPGPGQSRTSTPLNTTFCSSQHHIFAMRKKTLLLCFIHGFKVRAPISDNPPFLSFFYYWVDRANRLDRIIGRRRYVRWVPASKPSLPPSLLLLQTGALWGEELTHRLSRTLKFSSAMLSRTSPSKPSSTPVMKHVVTSPAASPTSVNGLSASLLL